MDLKDTVFDADMKRASLLSYNRFSTKLPSKKKALEELAPLDRFHLVHFMFFMFGFAPILPLSFITSAQDYWMYKFRNATLDIVDLDNKTTLQKNFVAVSSMAQAVPVLITTIISNRYAHKINITHRLRGAMILLVTTFSAFTAFTKINTDEWQIGFFILTIILSTISIICMILCATVNYALISRFPPTYMRSQLVGQGIAGIFSALLQITCLSIGGNSTTTGIIYFSGGTLVMVVGTVCAFTALHTPRFMHFLGDFKEDAAKPTQSLAQMKETAKKLWPNITALVVAGLTLGMAHPNVTVLVVSENYGKGSAWSDKYFTPVVTFLLTEVLGTIGRFFGRPIFNQQNAKWYVVIECARLVVVGPLFMFCNAKPRSHLPVLLDHDWEFIVLIGFYMGLGIFLQGSMMYSMSNMMEGDPEQGFLLTSTVLGVLMSATSPLGTLYVNIL